MLTRRAPRTGGKDHEDEAMANITAQMVKELRETTGAGMMDCKAALGETGGNVEAAIDWLRKKGLSKAAKKADRVAAEGLIGVPIDRHQGRRRRGQLRDRLRRAQRSVPGPREDDRRRRARRPATDVETIKAAKAGSITVAGLDLRDHRQDRREHDAAPRRVSCRSARASIGSYVHNAVSDGLGKMGVLVGARVDRQGRRADRARPPGRDARRRGQPAWRSMPPGVDPAIVEREKDVLADKFRQQGKPASDDREDRRVRPEDLLQGSLPARAAVHPRRSRRAWRRR